MSNNGTLQYMDQGGAYYRCGSTQKAMTPGFYDVVRSNAGWGLQPRATVSDELIDIPGTVADEIFSDIDAFISGRERYMRFNLTHKRGYLFYGPPGSGKTSLGLMLANRFIKKVGGVVMYAGNYHHFVEGVGIMRDVEPGRPSMYLIEEADDIVDNTECLSILDGELSIQGAVFVAMTNYKNKLPPRIANRPGRFDRVTLVDSPPPAVQIEYLRRIFQRDPGLTAGKSGPEKIVEVLTGLPLSMAHLREAFISHVLMELPLETVRTRFEQMAGLKSDGAEESGGADGDPDDGLKVEAERSCGNCGEPCKMCED